MKKLADLFKCFIPTISFLVLQLLSEAIIGMLMSLFYYGKGAGREESLEYFLDLSSDGRFLNQTTLVFEIFAVLVFTVSYFEVVYKRNGMKPNFFSKRSFPAIITFAMGAEILTGLFISMISAFLPNLVEKYNSIIEEMGISENMGFIMTLCSIILAPIAEELTFRGLTLYYTRKLSDKFWVGNLLQALLFGIIHLNLIQGVYAFILGYIFGMLYKRYNSIFASIIAHITFNICGTFLVPIIYGTGEYMSLLRLAIIILIAVSFTWIGAELIKTDKTTTA